MNINLSKKAKIIIGVVVGVLVVAGIVGASIAIANGVKKNKQAKCEHVYGEGEITAEATCEEAGAIMYTCGKCKYVLTEEIPANGHVNTVIEAVPATCTKKGLTDGVKCVTCDKVLVAPVDTPMLGHNVKALKAVAATCTTAGKTEGSICTRCNEVLKAQTVIPAKGHTVVELKGYAPTCTETGKTNGSMCSGCGSIYAEQEDIEKIGHSYIGGSCNMCGVFDLQSYVMSGDYTERTVGSGDKVMNKVFRIYRGTDLSTTSGFNLKGAEPMLIGYPQGVTETKGATTSGQNSTDSWDLSLYVSKGIVFIISDGYMDIYFPEGGVIDFTELNTPDEVSYAVIDEETAIASYIYGEVVELVKN